MDWESRRKQRAAGHAGQGEDMELKAKLARQAQRSPDSDTSFMSDGVWNKYAPGIGDESQKLKGLQRSVGNVDSWQCRACRDILQGVEPGSGGLKLLSTDEQDNLRIIAGRHLAQCNECAEWEYAYSERLHAFDDAMDAEHEYNDKPGWDDEMNSEKEEDLDPWGDPEFWAEEVFRIASCLTEDPDVFTKYSKVFNANTVLDEETYGEIVGILKDVAKQNGLILNHRNLKIKFNPAGMTIKNIDLDCPDAHTKRELAQRVAEITGDDNIKHTFNKNLKVNLYNAINREFSDRVREELNLEVTHQFIEPDEGDTSGVLPMATFTQPAVRAERPEEELEEINPEGPEPEGGPEVPPQDEGMGMGGGGGGLGGGLEGLPELPSEEGDEEIEAGPFGLEEPEETPEEAEEGEAEEAPPPEAGEEDEMVSFESVQRIANLLTEDPDIFVETYRCPHGSQQPHPQSHEECKGDKPLPCWVCGKPTLHHPYVDGRIGGDKEFGYCGCEV